MHLFGLKFDKFDTNMHLFAISYDFQHSTSIEHIRYLTSTFHFPDIHRENETESKSLFSESLIFFRKMNIVSMYWTCMSAPHLHLENVDLMWI